MKAALRELSKILREIILMHLVLLKRIKRKMIGLCKLLVNLLLNHLRIQMIFLFLMLKHNLVMNMNIYSDNINDDVHVDAQPSNDNEVEIEPAVDLDNPQSKNQRYDKRDFVAKKHG